MSPTTQRSAEDIRGATASLLAIFVPLDKETRHGVDTAAAAFYLNRRPQTLRIWACREIGALRPIRINGRLMWLTADIRKLCGMA